MSCTRFAILSRAIPFAGLRLALCQRHVERCPECRRESAGDETPSLPLLTAGQMAADLDLWPGVRAGIAGSAPAQPRPHRSRRWAYAAVLAALLLGAGFWIIFRGGHPELPPSPTVERSEVRPSVCSARIENQPARIFQIQSRNRDRAIFWIAKNNTGS